MHGRRSAQASRVCHLIKSEVACALRQALVQTPRWQRHEGADFVFYDPHPGFTTGRAEMPVLDMWCNTFRRGMHIVAERSQRNVCQHYWAMAPKVLVVPYVPATSDVTRPLKVGLETPHESP